MEKLKTHVFNQICQNQALFVFLIELLLVNIGLFVTAKEIASVDEIPPAKA